MVNEDLRPYCYSWPTAELNTSTKWVASEDPLFLERTLPESREELAADSRWPAFFPCALSIVTTSDGMTSAVEREVGAAIVNRFPYVVALSFCTKDLSARHHARRQFVDLLERGKQIAVQFLPPGRALNRLTSVIDRLPDSESYRRLDEAELPFRRGVTNSAPVFDSAYLVYEGKLVEPGKDFSGNPIYDCPWKDVGSHRLYFFEITALQLRQDIAQGQSQILWRSLPSWESQASVNGQTDDENPIVANGQNYQKGYTPHYAFPSSGTVAFEFDEVCDGMAIKHLPPLPEDQVEVDNDRARWPCFFPSSAGMITSWTSDGRPNLMPCGSTTVVSRNPLVIAPCVSYARINERYAPRASLEMLRRAGRFGCGVPFINEAVLSAIRYAGNISFADDPNKIARAGLHARPSPWGPVLAELPIHFDCRIIDEVALGTHIMFLGAVERILVRRDVTPDNPLNWFPWAAVSAPVQSAIENTRVGGSQSVVAR